MADDTVLQRIWLMIWDYSCMSARLGWLSRAGTFGWRRAKETAVQQLLSDTQNCSQTKQSSTKQRGAQVGPTSGAHIGHKGSQKGGAQIGPAGIYLSSLCLLDCCFRLSLSLYIYIYAVELKICP